MVEEVDMSNGTIMEALNNKADIDLNNLSVENKRALIEENKETIMGWMMPDYANKEIISTSLKTFTAPCMGEIYIQCYGGTVGSLGIFYINGIEVLSSTTVGSGEYRNNFTYKLMKDDVITWNGTSGTIYWYPYKI